MTNTTKNILTGIKPTGAPHIGNYIGALKPALDMAMMDGATGSLFIADFHALNLAKERANLAQNTLEMAAALLAMGLDPKKVTFYRQSDVPETFEMSTFITSFTPKGLMNRAHAYKAATQANREAGCKPEDEDIGVNMGLYNYPILMSADILLFDIDLVPVGRDQRQHVEFARDIAGSVNAVYGEGTLKEPAGYTSEDTEEIPGLDGRKMSKSYNNTIPVFASPDEVLKACKRITTDSRAPDEPKDKDCLVYKIYKSYATKAELADFDARFLGGGMGYGTVKQEIAALHEARFAKARETYHALLADPAHINAILLEGAEKARARARVVMNRVRSRAGFYVG